VRETPGERLDPRVVKAWRAGAAIWTAPLALILVVAGIAAAVMVPDGEGVPWLIGAVVLSAVLVVALVVVVPHVRYLRWRYEVTDTEVDLLKGIIIHTRTLIPLVRVQNVSSTRGPLMRAWGLASVTVATAAGREEIPGLSVEEAERLRDRVALLARIAQEDV